MCGITGIIELGSRRMNPEGIVKMTDEIAHRGPDGEGFLVTNEKLFCQRLSERRSSASVVSFDHPRSVALGHRRLSIVDLNVNAAQPMTEFSGRYWIVFNGEIYNHNELRVELQLAGYNFRTDHSDTEVILNAYACWGTDCLHKFNGMWSFCIWDTIEDTFFIARDRAGKKPLYYCLWDNTFYFASELKSILQQPEIVRDLDFRAIYDYLTFMTVPAPRTIFKKIQKLPAANYILFRRKEEIVIRQYWVPFRNVGVDTRSEDEIAEELREKIFEAVKLRNVADVEVGALLSGGIDSSINLAMLSKVSSRPVKAFTVGFENGKGYKNEFEYSRKVARQFSADYTELTLTTQDFNSFFPNMIYHQDEPIADPANIPLYYISKVARETGVKVLLGGEGSDELFAGYKLWSLSRSFSNVVEGRPGLAKVLELLHSKSPLRRKREYYLSWYEKVKCGQPVFWSGTELRTEKEKRSILSKSFLERIGPFTSFCHVEKLWRAFQSKGKGDPYEWMASADLSNRLPDLLLARLDRMTMAASVEGRTPFLDVGLIEFAMRIPPTMKFKNRQEKYILKKAFEGILPYDILYRPKDSFSVPMEQMIFSSSDQKKDVINVIERFNSDHEIFTQTYVRQLLKTGNGKELWNVINLALWCKRFV